MIQFRAAGLIEEIHKNSLGVKTTEDQTEAQHPNFGTHNQYQLEDTFGQIKNEIFSVCFFGGINFT